jgi:hypothetical protein
MERPDFDGLVGWVPGKVISSGSRAPYHHFPVGTLVWINPKSEFNSPPDDYVTHRAQGRTSTTKPFYQTVNRKDLFFFDEEVSEDEESSAIASIMRGYASCENA